jgi:hypothetical protein
MRLWSVIVVGMMLAGCQRVTTSQASPPTVSPQVAIEGIGALDSRRFEDDTGDREPQLEALIIDEHSTVAAVGGCPFRDDAIPPITAFAAAQLPEVDPRRARASNFSAGDERLNDPTLYARLLPLQGEILHCLDLASCYHDEEIGAGELDFQFELGADGHVDAVTVRPSPALDLDPVVPCARAALARVDFPTYDGGRMFVQYQVSID